MQTRRYFAIAGTLFLSLAQSSLVVAQPIDEGEYVILRARYGTARRNIDVTEQLRRLARHDRQAQVSNELFGDDPALGERKTLRIYAQGPGGTNRLFEYREREMVDGAQFRGWSEGWWGGQQHLPHWEDHDDRSQGQNLVIERATYGSGSRSIDVTHQLRQMVRRDSLVLRVENRIFDADPALGKNKALVVIYAINGRRQEKRVSEHGQLSLP